MDNNLTESSISIINLAYEKAQTMTHPAVSLEHLLSAILDSKDDIIKHILSSIDVSKIEKELDQHFKQLPTISGNTSEISLDNAFLKIINIAKNFSYSNGNSFIPPEHILYAIATTDNSKAFSILQSCELTGDKIINLSNAKRKGEKVSSKKDIVDAIQKYCINLTELAKQNKLPPVIGRDKEVRHAVRILYGYTKNNPILIGDPGVGKTAIVELLAQRIVDNSVKLENGAEIYSLDLGLVVSGTKFRGEFEERIKSIIKEIENSEGRIILFIDEIHTIVGAGSVEGGLDASNMLKPALARGKIKCIGATTKSEYKKYFEKDGALERRFQPIFIDEPTTDDTIAMLRGRKETLERHHAGITINDNALIHAVKLSSIYITNRFLPDKAIDLVDQAASMIRVEINSEPEEMERLKRLIMQMKIEATAISKESKNPSNTLKIKDLNNKIDKYSIKYNTLRDTWEKEKGEMNKISALKNQIQETENELELCKRLGNLEKASEIMYSSLPELKRQLKEFEEKKDSPLFKKNVTEKDIARILTQWTGIPVEQLIQDEKTKLIKMEHILKEKIISQDYAIKAISNTIRRSRTGVSNKNKPIGSFLFLGPTGVGKTEVAKVLAEFLFNSKENIVRIDMSEYMEKYSISNLIGSTPGYVGYERGGVLTEAVRHRPYQVVLFDEIEKADIEVLNLLLQILDDGNITDGQGRKINFKNTIVIMTSNLVTDIKKSDNLRKLLEKKLKPEFINRIDEIIMFNRLDQSSIEKVTEVQIKILAERIEQDLGISLHVDEPAIKKISSIGFDPQYGARPLKRSIQEIVENKISSMILEDQIFKGDKLTIGFNGENFTRNINNNEFN